MWVENCEFKYLPDDNMAVQSLKMSLAGIEEGNTAVLAKLVFYSSRLYAPLP